jgi:hypothetical protein
MGQRFGAVFSNSEGTTYLPNTIKMTKSRKMEWTAHAGLVDLHTVEIRKAYRIVGGKPK